MSHSTFSFHFLLSLSCFSIFSLLPVGPRQKCKLNSFLQPPFPSLLTLDELIWVTLVFRLPSVWGIHPRFVSLSTGQCSSHSQILKVTLNLIPLGIPIPSYLYSCGLGNLFNRSLKSMLNKRSEPNGEKYKCRQKFTYLINAYGNCLHFPNEYLSNTLSFPSLQKLLFLLLKNSEK